MEFVAWYGYDVYDRRISKSTLTEETYYAYDGGTLVEEYDGGLGDRLVYFNGVHQDEHLGMAVYDGQAWTRYAFVTDKLGSVVRVLDNQGTVVAGYEYDPYGRRTLVQGAPAFKVAHSFIGRYHDDETGLLYVRHRYYSPEFGRFLTQDPSGSWFDFGNWGNGMTYGMANPMGTLDRNGKFWGLTAIIGAAVGAAVGAIHALVTNGDVGSEALRGAIIGGMAGLGLGLGELAITTGATGATGAAVLGGVHATFGGIAGKALTDRKRLRGQSAAQNLTEFASDAALDLAVTAGVGLGVNLLPESVKEKLSCWILRKTSASPRKPSSTGGGVPKGGGSAVDAAEGVGRYLAGKAPKEVTPGVRVLEGQYVDDLGRVQPWRTHYDEYGRRVGRTDFNAGNGAAGIPDTHYHRYEYSAEFPLGREVERHMPGEFPGGGR